LLEGLENHGTKELTDTTRYSIEHILPQNERLSLAWRNMLGASWKEVHRTWLNRLGNLTLTGYNSKYSDRPFEEKKAIAGGFADSSVRLNKFVRDQKVWTATQLKKRTQMLAERAVECWTSLSVEKSLIDAANHIEMRALAARRDVSKVIMSAQARALFEELRKNVRSLDSDILELAESHSVSYHCPSFFLEVLPRRYSLTLLLPLDFSDIDDPDEIAEDATQWKFFVYAQYQGGVSISIDDSAAIKPALPLVRQALAASRA
jgi:predicted transport protein